MLDCIIDPLGDILKTRMGLCSFDERSRDAERKPEQILALSAAEGGK
jgi:hypothetical protein